MCTVTGRGPPSGYCYLNATIAGKQFYSVDRRLAQGLEEYVKDEATFTAEGSSEDLTISWACALAANVRCGLYLDSVSIKQAC